jgi:hypothetical protein
VSFVSGNVAEFRCSFRVTVTYKCDHGCRGGVTSVCAATVLNLNAILDGRMLSTFKGAKPSLVVTPCPRRGSIRELVREEQQFMNGFRLLMVGMHMHLRHDMNRCHFYLLTPTTATVFFHTQDYSTQVRVARLVQYV